MEIATCSSCGSEHPGGITCLFCHKPFTGHHIVPLDPLVTVDKPEPFYCVTCGGEVKERCVVACDAVWHPGCFLCTSCSKPITETYFSSDSKGLPHHSYCLVCEEGKVCTACGDPFTDWILFGVGKRWHPRCFVCSYCQNQIGAEEEVSDDGAGRAVHIDCMTKWIEELAKREEPNNGHVVEEEQRLAGSGAVHAWSVNRVVEWLSKVGMQRFQFNFKRENIDGGRLLQLSFGEMKEILGIQSLDARRQLGEAVDKLRDTYPVPPKGTRPVTEFQKPQSESDLKTFIVRHSHVAEPRRCQFVPVPTLGIMGTLAEDGSTHKTVEESRKGVKDPRVLPRNFRPTATASMLYRLAAQPNSTEHVENGANYAFAEVTNDNKRINWQTYKMRGFGTTQFDPGSPLKEVVGLHTKYADSNAPTDKWHADTGYQATAVVALKEALKMQEKWFQNEEEKKFLLEEAEQRQRQKLEMLGFTGTGIHPQTPQRPGSANRSRPNSASRDRPGSGGTRSRPGSASRSRPSSASRTRPASRPPSAGRSRTATTTTGLKDNEFTIDDVASGLLVGTPRSTGKQFQVITGNDDQLSNVGSNVFSDIISHRVKMNQLAEIVGPGYSPSEGDDYASTFSPSPSTKDRKDNMSLAPVHFPKGKKQERTVLLDVMSAAKQSPYLPALAPYLAPSLKDPHVIATDIPTHLALYHKIHTTNFTEPPTQPLPFKLRGNESDLRNEYELSTNAKSIALSEILSSSNGNLGHTDHHERNSSTETPTKFGVSNPDKYFVTANTFYATPQFLSKPSGRFFDSNLRNLQRVRDEIHRHQQQTISGEIATDGLVGRKSTAAAVFAAKQQQQDDALSLASASTNEDNIRDEMNYTACAYLSSVRDLVECEKMSNMGLVANPKDVVQLEFYDKAKAGLKVVKPGEKQTPMYETAHKRKYKLAAQKKQEQVEAQWRTQFSYNPALDFKVDFKKMCTDQQKVAETHQKRKEHIENSVVKMPPLRS